MKKITVKTPAKINYTLEILNKRPDGFHNLQSVMQAVSLYDFLEIEKSQGSIVLTGNSSEISYDERNIVYKASKLFFDKTGIKSGVKINIEKHIPVAAGMAGGSADAAGAIFALNDLFGRVLNDEEVNELCAALGSDLNFCLKGGCALCTSRGEKISPLAFVEQNISIVKPKNLGISAKEAYIRFDELTDKTVPDNTSKLAKLLSCGNFDEKLLYNSFENALFPFYPALSEIKTSESGMLMSGSGSAFFALKTHFKTDFDENKYEIFENLKTVLKGAEII